MNIKEQGRYWLSTAGKSNSPISGSESCILEVYRYNTVTIRVLTGKTFGYWAATYDDDTSISWNQIALKSDLAALTLSISSTDDLNAFLAASSIGQLAFCHMTATFTTGSQGSGFVKKMSATIVDMLYMIDTCNIMTCRYDSSSGTLTKYKIALTKVE